MNYDEVIVDATDGRIISRLFYPVGEGITKVISKRKEYFEGIISSLAYIVINRSFSENVSIPDCVNKTYDFLEKLIIPEKMSGYYDDEENMYFGGLYRKGFSANIEADIDLKCISVIFNTPSEENEKELDQVAIDISKMLYELCSMP